MAVRSFRAVVGKDGPNPFVDVPAAVSRAFAAFAESGRIRVAGTLQGHPLHATLVPKAGGVHRLYVSGGTRAATGVRVGDRVAIALRALRPGEVGVPPDLARALTKASEKRRFDRLSPAHRRELVRSIDDARTARNRAVRIERTLQHLRGERTQQPRPGLVDEPLWTCPRCGHAFVTRSMSHSCARHDLGFWFTERDEDPRFSKVETIATNAHVHRVRIRAPGELDGAVRRWIDRAHRVGCREHLRRGAEG